MLHNPCNYIFTLITFSCELVNNFELMFWKGGQISIVNYSYKKTLNDNLCNVQKLISCTFWSNDSVNQRFIYTNTFFVNFISLWLSCFDRKLTGISEFYSQSWFLDCVITSKENMIKFPTTNQVFTDLRLNFKWLGLAPVMSSQDKRSYNRLLSENDSTS